MINNIINGLAPTAFIVVVGLIIYFSVRPKSRFRTRFESSKAADIVLSVFGIISILFIVGVASIGGINYYITESAWFPRTREVSVAVKAPAWVTGELKMCFSVSTPEKGELTALVCNFNSEETHSLNVKFWGTITTEHDKVWKREREEASLTCKLQ